MGLEEVHVYKHVYKKATLPVIFIGQKKWLFLFL